MILKSQYLPSVKKSNHKHCQLLVSKLCANAKGVVWGKEIKMAQKLLKLYPDIDFWSKIDPAEGVTTLSWYLTEEGKSWLKQSDILKDFKLSKQKRYSLAEEKLIETETINTKKPKTIFDFLDYGKNKEN